MFNIWKNSLSNDWLYQDARNYFSLVEYYTELEWTRMLKGPIKTTEKLLNSIYDLFTTVGIGNKKIYIEGEAIALCHLFTARIRRMGKVIVAVCSHWGNPCPGQVPNKIGVHPGVHPPSRSGPKVRMEGTQGYPPPLPRSGSRSGQGLPRGTPRSSPRSGWEVPRSQEWMGIPPGKQTSRTSTCYGASGMPLAFTRRTFLFNLKCLPHEL